MKTIQELYNEVLKSEELKKAFSQAVQSKTVEGFLKAHGCETSMDEVAAFLKEQQAKTGELADSELENVVGGCDVVEAQVSIVSLGYVCALQAIKSASEGNTTGKYGRILCDSNIAGAGLE